jgi:hypothetical protein
MKNALSAAVLTILLLAGSAAEAAPRGGSSEVQASGGFFHSEGSDEGSLNADLSYGFFFHAKLASGCPSSAQLQLRR